jgi:predicted DNA-binding antitoxin AbrB/MazE fold protein
MCDLAVLKEGRPMSIVVEATYEDGVLKPSQPLPLAEREKVRVTVEQEPAATQNVPSSDGLTLAERLAAMARELPPGALDNLPDDLAAEHDHYLYGTPKRGA